MLATCSLPVLSLTSLTSCCYFRFLPLLSPRSLIQIPVAAAQAFYSRLGGLSSGNGDGTYIIPCDVPIGSIAFVFNGVHYEIPPTDLLRAISRDRSQCLLTIAGVDNKDARGNDVAIVSRTRSFYAPKPKLTYGRSPFRSAMSSLRMPTPSTRTPTTAHQPSDSRIGELFYYKSRVRTNADFLYSNIAGDWADYNGTNSGSNDDQFQEPTKTGTVSIANTQRPQTGTVETVTGGGLTTGR